MVLQGSGEQLGGARGSIIDEHGDGKVVGLRVFRDFHILRRAFAPLHPQDVLPGLQEERRYRDGGFDNAAGVLAQIEDQAVHAIGLQALDRRAEITGRCLFEIRQLDVGETGFQKEDMAHARVGHLGGDEFHRNQARKAGPFDHQLSPLLPRLSEQLNQLIDVQPGQRIAVDDHDLVARREAGTRGGAVRQGLQDDDSPRQERDNAAEALFG